MESKSVLFVGVRDGEVVEGCCQWLKVFVSSGLGGSGGVELGTAAAIGVGVRDRKSTRLNSSHRP